MGTLLLFLENYCAAADAKKYCAFKREEIVNLTIFSRFSFLYSGNIRGIFSKYFQNHFYEACISSVSQRSTT